MDPGGQPSIGQCVLLATSSALTGIFYLIYKKNATTANRLKEAEKVSLDQDLKRILSEAPGRCVPYAVIEGTVQAVKETLNSQFIDNCKGVIEQLTLKEKRMVWNRTTHLWNDTEKVIHQHTNSVPFAIGSLNENVSSSVRIIRPLEAVGLELVTTHHKFYPTMHSFTNTISHFITGEKTKGILETEEMLRVEECITGVGELVLENNLIKLQPPKEGFCYFLSLLDYDTLLRKQEVSVQMWKIITTVFGVAACSSLVYILWKKLAHYRQRARNRRAMDEFKAQHARDRRAMDEFNARQRQRQQEMNLDEDIILDAYCAVCLSKERECVFLECGHVCTCLQCYEALPGPKTCPICRRLIARVVPLFNS